MESTSQSEPEKEQLLPSENDADDEKSDSGLRRRKVVSCAKETFENASRLLRRKIPCAGHFMAPRKLWLQRVATPHCDVVMTFPPNAQDSVLLWLLARFRQSPGLTVHVRHHASTHSTAFYLTAPFSVLLKAAEEYHLPKVLKASRGGGLKEFSIQDAHSFDGIDKEAIFFTTQERQWLVLRLLQSIRATEPDTLQGLNLLEGQPIVPKCLSTGIISQVFPLHEGPAVDLLQVSWVRNVLAYQPLDLICEYFGVKITMYFAWLGHYTAALSIPAVVGFIFWICCSGKHQHLEDVGYVLFSVFNVIWATTYLQAWKRYSAELAFRWGTLDQRDDLLAEPRPFFSGPLQISPVTGRLEPWQPAWKRHVFRYCVTVPVIAMCLSLVFAVMIASFQLQSWWDSKLAARGYPSWLGYVPKILLAVVISLMDEAYYKVAVWLNDKENYRLETKYENHLIGKVALFQFVNSFLSLFYIAFYIQDQARLKEQLAALLIARQVIGNLKESALPYMLEQMRLAKLSFDLWGALSPTSSKEPPGTNPSNADEQTVISQSETTKSETQTEQSPSTVLDSPQAASKRSISQAELESSLYKYDGTFDDHLEMVIQLGYVVLFSSAFPPAALCAMLNNFIEIRSDAFKLTYVCQRPFGQRVSNIGTWQNAMEYMCLMAVLVNCALIGLSGQVHRMFPDMTATQTILLIVALEHIMLCIRFLISCAIPELPSWLATEMAKIEWARREAGRLTATATPSPEQVDNSSQLIGRFSVTPSHSTSGGPPTSEDSAVVIDDKSKSEDIETAMVEKSSPASAPITPPAPPVKVSAEDRIQKIPPFKPRKSGDWLATEAEGGHHLTIGPSGGAEWARRLKNEGSDDLALHRSTGCISPKDASSSDSDLFRSNPLWPPMPRTSPPVPSVAKSIPRVPEASLSDSSRTLSSVEGDADAQAKAEELAAKKTRVKQSLMKRARSVAIFSLKLKERRAREAAAKGLTATTPSTPTPPPQLPPAVIGGELSCIPIEKLIQVDDVVRHRQPPQQSSSSGGST